MEGQGESNLSLPLLTGASEMDQHFQKIPVVQRKKLTLLACDLPAMSASGSPAHLGLTLELADVFLGNTKKTQGSLTQDRGCVRQQNLGGSSNLCPSIALPLHAPGPAFLQKSLRLPLGLGSDFGSRSESVRQESLFSWETELGQLGDT